MTTMVATRSHKIFCRNLRRLLIEGNVSQTDLATRMGVTPSYVSQILSGRSCPSLDVVDRISVALKCQPFELLLPAQKKSAA